MNDTVQPLVEVNSEESTMPPLRDCVKHAVETFFHHLDGQAAHGLYNLVLKEVEEPLLATVMSYTQNNQTKAALWLGLSRGTLRKKLEEYGLSQPGQ